MAQRHEAPDALDFFPTPPWATRALCEHVLPMQYWTKADLADHLVWEPACGSDDMVRPLAEYFREVIGTDAHDYGHASTHDFLMPYVPRIVTDRGGAQWIITNPPFRLAEDFLRRGLEIAIEGVAILARSVFMESVRRYLLYSEYPPLIVAPFSERVPMIKGRLDAKASSATSYAWFVWLGRRYERTRVGNTRLIWIPPCRKALERAEDYQ